MAEGGMLGTILEQVRGRKPVLASWVQMSWERASGRRVKAVVKTAVFS